VTIVMVSVRLSSRRRLVEPWIVRSSPMRISARSRSDRTMTKYDFMDILYIKFNIKFSIRRIWVIIATEEGQIESSYNRII
jgi:hypothetical protein